MSNQLPWPEEAVRIRLPAVPGYRLITFQTDKKLDGAKRHQPLSHRLTRRLAQQLTVEFPDGSIYVDAPMIQQATNWECAIIAMSFARLYDLGPDNMEDFLKGMGTKRSGTDPDPINKYLRKIGFKSRIETDMTESDLLDLYDEEIGAMLAVQAWGDPRDYRDPKNCENGHWIGGIGYFSGPPNLSGRLNTNFSRRMKGARMKRMQLSVKRATAGRINYMLFADPSIVGRHGYMSWPNLDLRWRDSAGPRSKPVPNRHLAIIMDPNGRKPVFNSIADEIL
jgi:hypothetical protein